MNADAKIARPRKNGAPFRVQARRGPHDPSPGRELAWLTRLCQRLRRRTITKRGWTQATQVGDRVLTTLVARLADLPRKELRILLLLCRLRLSRDREQELRWSPLHRALADAEGCATVDGAFYSASFIFNDLIALENWASTASLRLVQGLMRHGGPVASRWVLNAPRWRPEEHGPHGVQRVKNQLTPDLKGTF